MTDLPEPAAWRWRFDDEADWSYGTNKPGKFRFGDPIVVAPLFALDQLLSERQRAERAEEVIRSSIAEMKLMATEGEKQDGEHRKFYQGVESAIDTLEMRFARYGSLTPSQLCCDPQGCGVQMEAATRRAERAEQECNRLLGMMISRENLKMHLGIDADMAAVDVAKKFMLQRNEAERRAETAEALAETNRLWAEKEHAEGVRLSERLKEAEAVIEPFANFDTEDFPDTMRLFDDDASLRIEHLRAAAQFMEKAKP